jgi:hypothetical protein
MTQKNQMPQITHKVLDQLHQLKLKNVERPNWLSYIICLSTASAYTVGYTSISLTTYKK